MSVTAKRKIIEIDEAKCTGCGRCIPNCYEGALQLIDGKARLISDLFCDGLGACVGHCPEGAMQVVERDAEPYDERKVMGNIVRQGTNTTRAHLKHLKDHGAVEFLDEALAYLKERGIPVPAEEPSPCAGGGCPGSRTMSLDGPEADAEEAAPAGSRPSRLRNWPVQITLVPVNAPYFKGADLLVAADCTAFAYADFHEDLVKGRILMVGCPKLDDAEGYAAKLARIFAENDIKSVTVARMTVPCCFGIAMAVKEAMAASGKRLPYREVVIGVKGEVAQDMTE